MEPGLADTIATEIYALVMRSIGVMAPDDIIEAISLRLQIAHVQGERAAFEAALRMVQEAA